MFMHRMFVKNIDFKEKYNRKVVILYKKEDEIDCALINKEQYR